MVLLQYPRSLGDYAIRNVRDLTTGYDDNQPDKKAVSDHFGSQVSSSLIW